MKYDPASPPRDLSWRTRWAILFGGLNQLWWFLAAFAMIPGLITYFNLRGVFEINRGEILKTTGMITDTTHHSSRGGSYSDIVYGYTVNHHQYSRSCSVSASIFKPGRSVTIIHSKNYPEQGYIPSLKGCSPESTIPFYFFATFGGVFLLIILYQLLKGAGYIKLLIRGEVTDGELFLHERDKAGVIYDKRRRARGNKIREFNIHTLTFEYHIPESRHKQYLKVKTFFTKSITDQERETILYNPQNPEEAVLLDLIPGDLTINRRGNFETAYERIHTLFNAPLAVLISPVIAYAIYFLLYLY